VKEKTPVLDAKLGFTNPVLGSEGNRFTAIPRGGFTGA